MSTGGFNVEVIGKPSGFLVQLRGRAGGPESEQMEEQLAKLVALKPAMVVLDMEKLEYLSSMGISALIRLNRQLKEINGKLRIAAVPPAISKLLQAAKLDSLVPIFHTVDQAMG